MELTVRNVSGTALLSVCLVFLLGAGLLNVAVVGLDCKSLDGYNPDADVDETAYTEGTFSGLCFQTQTVMWVFMVFSGMFGVLSLIQFSTSIKL